jgi:NADPH:quinone reductase-like Zn-dependent oxidoreductase
MHAIAASKYGSLDNLAPLEVPVPEPKPHQVRVRVNASALNPADYKVILGTLKFVHARNFPMVVGYDFSGTIDAVGGAVSGFRAGDEVFGFLPYSPSNRRGAFAEMLVADATEIAPKPAGVSHVRAAAAATPGVTAIQMIRDLGRLPKKDGRVLVTGASGGVGSIAIGVARKLGAHVTAIGSGSGLDLAKKLGAHEVIDRKNVDVLSDAVKGPFDVIADAAAAYRWSTMKRKLVKGGTFVSTLPSLAFAVDKAASLFASTRVEFVNVKARAADLELLARWLADGLEVTVDRVTPVRDVSSAMGALHRGEATGRIAIDVASGF